MHRCPGIMTRDCKSPQPLMYAIQGATESNPKGRIRLCIICFMVRAQYGSGPPSSGHGRWLKLAGNVSNTEGMR
jgi:hypothetical protein